MQLLGDTVLTSTTKLFAENPNPTLTQVLNDPDLMNSLRFEISCVVNFLSKDEIIKELLMWCLTTTYFNKNNYDRFQRMAVLILSSASKAFQDKIMDNAIFIKTLQDFMKIENSKNLRICGHFQRIMVNMIKFTNGGFLKHFPGLPIFLIQQVHILAFRELLLRLLTDFASTFSDKDYQDIAYKLCESTAYSFGFFSATVIRDVISEKRELISFYQQPNAVKALLHIVCSRKIKHSFNSVFQATIFKVLQTLSEENEVVQKIISKYAPKFKFDPSDINCGTIAALRIFPHGIDALIDRFFESPTITILNDILVNQIDHLPDDELGALITKHKIVQKIIQAYPTNKVNGYLTELAIVLADRENACDELQSDEWLNFCDGPLRDIEESRNVPDEDDEGPAVDSIIGQDKLKTDAHISSDAAQNLKAAGIVSIAHSFTIPTVYQAEINLQPLIC